MRKIVRLCAWLALFAATAGGALAKDPARDILGVRPGMSADEARRRLDKAGKRQTAERMKHEVWEVRDPRIAHVGVRFDAQTRVVRWVTAIARADARRRLRYADVGDTGRVTDHKTDGTNHTYIWKVPARRGRPGYVVEALGNDPVFLTSYRILRTFE
ncbi:MAG: hypothetical protein M3416_11715 [Acidobacteriota bacterium]|nr:hypothetical protein [Acidobacteriota bacterium]